MYPTFLPRCWLLLVRVPRSLSHILAGMLMDIMNNSTVLADILRSITANTTQLALVFYLFVVTVIIYAQVRILCLCTHSAPLPRRCIIECVVGVSCAFANAWVSCVVTLDT